MEIYERIKYLRKELLQLTQETFSSAINISRSNLGSIEIGRVSVTNRVISDICKKYKVNEEWLREGKGEPFTERTRNQVITDFLSETIIMDNDSFKKRVVEAIANLDEEDWIALEKIALKFLAK
ncbi:MAG: helix-turn-helix transcriptional regulator [bacterium]|nr:helix-turn-helix transcriptional regulator [bacterium]